MSDLVRTDRHGAVLVISFHRPDRHNAINDAMFEAWRSAVTQALDDADTRALILSGDGPSFSSGRDLAELGHRAHGQSHYEFIRAAQQLNRRLVHSPKPIIAAIHGHTIGGAAEIALAADIRIAADDLRFSLPEIGFGLIPDTGASALLTRLVGPARAKWMIMAARTVDAETALRWGLVDEVVTRDELLPSALALAERIASVSPLAIAFAKTLIDTVDRDAVARAFDAELAAQVALFHARDLGGGTDGGPGATGRGAP